MKKKYLSLMIILSVILSVMGIKNIIVTYADASSGSNHNEKEPAYIMDPAKWEAELIPQKIYSNWERQSTEKPLIPLVKEVKQESPAVRALRFREIGIGYDDISEPVINLDGRTILTDQYQSARFMMREHSIRMNGDCASCHHKTPVNAIEGMSDRQMELLSCEACHQNSQVHDSDLDRLGLKAAYHAKCTECHKQKTSRKAPENCNGCHERKLPEHEEFFTVKGEPEKVTPQQVTALCLECHPKAGKEMVKSAHYKWGGAVSEWSVLEEGHKETGKILNAVNNNCISPFADWGPCTKCHVGYGVRDENGQFSKNPLNVDCLSCHAEEDTYGKSKKGMPDSDVDLVWAAGLVGKPTRTNCGECHHKAGGGNGRKGTLYNALNEPGRDLDVHMGGDFDMGCSDCHKAKQHKIAGRHSSVGVDEGIVECTDCHADKPHAENEMGKHIDRHVASVKCSTCHIPTYSRAQYTRYHWDWRPLGEKEKIEKDPVSGKPAYLPDEGIFKWDKNVKPHYSWDNNHTKRYVLGDKIEDLTKTVQLSRNLGSYSDPESKIGPFKLFTGWQPADKVHKYLLVPQNSGKEGVWETKDWTEPLHLGMKDAGLPFSGEFTFVPTELRFRPRHEVAPKEAALSCVQCHTETFATEQTAENKCQRCHIHVKMDQVKTIIAKGKGKADNYLDWKQLGYKEDPVNFGGRFSQ